MNVIRNLLSKKFDPPDTFNKVAVAALAFTGFQHVSRVGEMRGHSALLSALVERWRPETYTFHLSVGEVTVTLEDVSYILDLPIIGEAVTGRSDSSHQFFVENCIACFGREPGPQDHVRAINLHQWLAVSECYNTRIEAPKNPVQNSYTLNLLTLTLLIIDITDYLEPNFIPTLNSPSSAAVLPSPTTCAPPSVRQGK
ncbi:hypothetical protein AHAS_Ahas16G0167000 [Arachis hypogaea]